METEEHFLFQKAKSLFQNEDKELVKLVDKYTDIYYLTNSISRYTKDII